MSKVVNLNVEFVIEEEKVGGVSEQAVQQAVQNILDKERDAVGIDFNGGGDTFVESITVEETKNNKYLNVRDLLPNNMVLATTWHTDDLMDYFPEGISTNLLVKMLKRLENGLSDVAVSEGWEFISFEISNLKQVYNDEIQADLDHRISNNIKAPLSFLEEYSSYPEAVICLDMDEDGKQAAKSINEAVHAHGYSQQAVFLESDQDAENNDLTITFDLKLFNTEEEVKSTLEILASEAKKHKLKA